MLYGGKHCLYATAGHATSTATSYSPTCSLTLGTFIKSTSGLNLGLRLDIALDLTAENLTSVCMWSNELSMHGDS